ncbi:hypothetical protein B0T25DRAFT_237439 [Lasiosphaeria hispida]|uniref:Nucleotide-diphospho-sugar transferase domain-containing protein n=1 Tax=Lasiosphaeria hispida TaxID=260671 RepID=A0AAJ0HEU0_9PEZI|nr:hypothetical protein B0T25DRAFT_237439 [Lasiosphaeria hispida]
MTAISAIPQSWRRLLFLLPIVIISLVVTAGLLHGPIPRPRLPKVIFGEDTRTGPLHSECKANNETSRLDGLPDVIRAIFAPVLLPITAPSFTTLDGTVKNLPPADQLIHKVSLGKRICILDVDTRDLTDEGSIFSDHLPLYDNLRPASAGFLSHYTYAMIHGYSYKFIKAPKYGDRAPHWSKVIFTQELLKRFDIVVMMDYDAMFPSPEVPLEWMLNYWKIDNKVMVAMAEDPNVEVNYDLRKRVNINSGFIIAQASENTQRMFKDWAECPAETRYEGCAVWKDKVFHEQAAFSSHLRYDFLDGMSIDTHPEYIRMLPCNEANGIPEVKHLGCTGQLVRHYWGHKDLTTREFSHNFMAALVPQIIKAAYGDSAVVENYRDKVLDGDQILDKP